MKLNRRLLIAFAATCLSLTITAPLKAETNAADHSHGHDEHAAAGLSLDQGKKWQTDAPLRQGMLSIKDAAMKAAGAFHHDALTKPDAEKLAKHVNDQVAYLVANCKLEPQADATLHVLIGEMLQGAEILSKKPLSADGLPKIIKTLQMYPDYFNHPGWALDH